MEFWKRIAFAAFAVNFLLVLGGCSPTDQSTSDDEKEPHFVLGQNRVSAMDYQGAVEAFEESLEANPHSAPAHFQLAMLYDEKESNPAAAIYHYQQYLHFNPKASNAEVIEQRIYTCKQELAADVLPLPSAPAAQQQLQQLADTNRFLQSEVDYYTRQLAMIKTNAPPTVASSLVPQPTSPIILPPPTATSPKPTPAKVRTHTVAAGETPAAIARKCGVSLTALLAANPGLQPTHLHVGQVINLPPP
jgi:LysM repeat protein